MKALRTLLTAVVLLAGSMTMNAQGMSITVMRDNARFLTDRMAFTLGVRDPYLIDEIYRINYDYICGVNDYLDDVAMGYYYDDYMTVVTARDAALRLLLGNRLWNRLTGYTYFHRPITFANHRWHFAVYDHDRHGIRHFHYGAPRPYGAGYAGGHIVRPMPPRRPAAHRPAPPRPAHRPVAPPRMEHRPSAPHASTPSVTPRNHGNRNVTPPRSGNNTRSSSRTNTGTFTRTALRR